MARPREFDETIAVAQARELFWRDGYAGTSLSALLDAMGISKSSFYETFGSKHALFLRTLGDYQDTQADRFASRLSGKDCARAAIEALFRDTVAAEEHRGCMTCNEAVELAPSDPIVAGRIAEAHSGLERLLTETIARGQDSGAIGRRYEAPALARLLALALSGLQIMIRAQTDRARLDETVEIILELLD